MKFLHFSIDGIEKMRKLNMDFGKDTAWTCPASLLSHSWNYQRRAQHFNEIHIFEISSISFKLLQLFANWLTTGFKEIPISELNHWTKSRKSINFIPHFNHCNNKKNSNRFSVEMFLINWDSIQCLSQICKCENKVIQIR